MRLLNSSLQLPPVEVEDNVKLGPFAIKPRSTCVMFFGKRGSGKSAVMARFARLEHDAGRKVWYWPEDYGFKPGVPISVIDLYSLPEWLRDGTVLLDEIQVLLNRMRTISTADLIGATMLQQLRKRNLNIFGTSNQPGKIDSTVALQTDWHAHCEYYTDMRCDGKTHHLANCHDAVKLKLVDTNQALGSDPRYKDGRKRSVTVAHNIRREFDVYNTDAIADVVDAIGVTKEQIMERRASKNMGIGNEELIDAVITRWVPWMVGQGHTTLAVGAFTRYVNAEFEYEITTGKMGVALNAAGLETRRTSKARIVDLPPADKVEAFQMGAWSAQE